MGAVKTLVGGLRLDEAEVRGLGPHAVAALAIGAWHCAVNLTDGVLTPRALVGLGIGYAARKKLVDAGLWKESDGGAIEVVDYLEHNPSRADVERGEHRKPASLRQARWREHKRLQASTQPSTEASTGVYAEPSKPSTPPSTDCDAAPAPPSDLILRSDSGSGSSSLPCSSGDLAGSARVSARRAKRVFEKPELMTWGWCPPQSAVDATQKKLECLPADFDRHLPDFRHYWIDGKGRGKRRTPRGWVQAWMNRMTMLAEQGQLYMSRGAANGGNATLRPDQEDRVARLLATARH